MPPRVTRTRFQTPDMPMLSRRHALACLAAVAALPRTVRADVAQPRGQIRDDLAKRFDEAGTAGTFVGYLTDDYSIVASDSTRSGEAILPASTFKIPNSLIALETGVVADPDKDVFKWDGVKRPFPDWNRDHTLRSAIAASAVPVYQEIARRIGAERMQSYVRALDYGNKDIGGGIDRFWLTGAMRIDPMQQIDFLDRLRRGALPVSKRSQTLTRDILPVEKAGEAVIRYKTGLVGIDDRTGEGGPSASVGWLVGWAEKAGGGQTVFALNLDIREPRHMTARMTLAKQLLGDIGAI